MEKNIAEAIVENDQNGDLHIYEDYSGRGMYGEKTTGVVGSQGDFMAAAVNLAHELGMRDNREEEGEDEEEITIEDLAESMHRIKVDNMGRSDLIFY